MIRLPGPDYSERTFHNNPRWIKAQRQKLIGPALSILVLLVGMIIGG